MKRVRTLAAKTGALAIAFMGVFMPNISSAGIPVLDGTNLGQNTNTAMQSTMTAVEEVAQTAKQIQEYATQLDQYATQLLQYDNMLTNTLAPVANIWGNATQTMQALQGSYDTITGYGVQYGNLQNYLNQYKDINTYTANNPCYSGNGGCNNANLANIQQSRQLGSQAQWRANSGAIRAINNQQNTMQRDAATLGRLQMASQGARGQMQALGYSNQIASEQTHQLLQIRGTMIAQQNAEIARNQALADQEAQEEAAKVSTRRGAFVASARRAW